MGTLRASVILNDSSLMLIAVESVDLQPSKMGSGCFLHGNIKPIAVVVCGVDGIYAIDMEAKIIRFDQLRQDTPELDAMTAPFK